MMAVPSSPVSSPPTSPPVRKTSVFLTSTRQNSTEDSAADEKSENGESPVGTSKKKPFLSAEKREMSSFSLFQTALAKETKEYAEEAKNSKRLQKAATDCIGKWCCRLTTQGEESETIEPGNQPASPSAPVANSSHLDEHVIHALIEAYPEAAKERVADQSLHRSGRKRSSKRMSLFASSSTAEDIGLYPIDLYFKKTGNREISDPYIVSMLLGSIPMAELVDLVERPETFKEIEALYDKNDRYAIERWVEDLMFRNLSSRETESGKMKLKARAAFVMTCIPIKSPSQYQLTSSEGLEMQTRFFHAIQATLLQRRKTDWSRDLLMEKASEYILAFVQDDDLLTGMQNSNPSQESVETLTSAWIIQIALAQAFNRGPRILFCLESIIHVVQLVSYILITSIVDYTWRPRPVFLGLASVGFVMDAGKLAYLMYRLRKQEIEDLKMDHEPLLVQIFRHPLLFICSISTGFRTDAWNWVNMTKVICVGIELVTQWDGILTEEKSAVYGSNGSIHQGARTAVAAIGALLLWIQIVWLLKDLHPRFATFVLMVKQIFFEIIYFLIIFILMLLGFAHMYSIIYRSVAEELLAIPSVSFPEDSGTPLYAKRWLEALRTVFLLALGDLGFFDAFNEARADQVYWSELGWFFLSKFVVVLLLMNILIAIVSDAYDDAMARSEKLFWFSRLDLIAEYGTMIKPGPRNEGGSFPNWMMKSKEVLLKEIRKRLEEELIGTKPWTGRIMDIFRKVSDDSEYKTRRLQSEIKDTQAMVKAQTQGIQTEVTKLAFDLSRIEKSLLEVTKNQERSSTKRRSNVVREAPRRHTQRDLPPVRDLVKPGQGIFTP